MSREAKEAQDARGNVEHRRLPVPDGLDGERADVGLARMLGVSRTQAAAMASDGLVHADGRPVGRSDRLLAGQWLDIDVPRVVDSPGDFVSPDAAVELPVVHADEDIIVVDKPAGVAAHASVGWTGPTVLASLAAAGHRITTSGVPERQGIVQRLDVGTSGLMVVAKSERAYTSLKRQFRERTPKKVYHSLVQGHPDPSRGTIDAPIGRHPGHDYRFAVLGDGRPSVTHYETIEAMRYASLLEIGLETGRTHQIRVHMAALHHPCVGDLTYGADPVLAKRLGLERQWLHAVRLGFEHPGSGEWVGFTSDYPADLQLALDRI